MEARLTLRRVLVCAAATLALVSVASACGGGSDARAAVKDPPLAKYTGSGLSFSHPTAWAAYPYKGRGELHFQPLVYLSTQPVHEPCSTQGTVTSCGFPVGHLQPGGALVTWQSPYMLPGMGLGTSGMAIQVAGSPARRTATSGGMCRSIGADRTVDVMIEKSSMAFVEVTACLRGPGLAQAEKSFDAMVASTQFLSQ